MESEAARGPQRQRRVRGGTARLRRRLGVASGIDAGSAVRTKQNGKGCPAILPGRAPRAEAKGVDVGDVDKETLLKGARENREAIRKFAEANLGWDVKDDEITAIVVRVRP